MNKNWKALSATFFLTVIALAVPVAAESRTWLIDGAHSGVQFSIRHMTISNVRGSFSKVRGGAIFDLADPVNASVEATIEAASIDTRNDARDKDLRSAEYFDVARFPTLSFKSTHIQRVSDGKLLMNGELTLHGITKPVALKVEGPTAVVKDSMGHEHIGFVATTIIQRKDFGLTWSQMIESIIGDEVNIELDIELVKQPIQQSHN